MYKAYVKMSPKKYRALDKGKTITVNTKTNENDPEIELEFNSRKAMNKVHRNLAKGSGVRIKKSDLTGMRVVGGNIGKQIKKAFTKAGDKIKEGAFAVDRGIKSSPVSKAIVGTIAPELAGLALQYGTTALTGSPELGKIASMGTKAGVKAGLKSEGYGLRKLNKNTLSPIAEGGALEVMSGQSVGGNQPINKFDPPKKRGRPKKSGGSVDMATAQSGIAVGGVNPIKEFDRPQFKNASERMAWVRSKRKSGGSFLPLGGSFLPLGKK